MENRKGTRKHDPALTGYARALRKNMTAEERRLWYTFLKDYPVRFLRQKVIDHYIADFYCAKARLIIELDGSQHYEAEGMAQDAIRTEVLEARGLTVMRIPNDYLKAHFREACEAIDQAVRGRTGK